MEGSDQINRLFVVESRNQSSLNRWLTESPFCLEELNQARLKVGERRNVFFVGCEPPNYPTIKLSNYSPNSSFRSAGNNSTSRILRLLVSNMTRRSTPMPKPPLGGMP